MENHIFYTLLKKHIGNALKIIIKTNVLVTIILELSDAIVNK